MNIDELAKRMAGLDHAVLQAFICQLYQQYPELETQIETLVLQNDPKALTGKIKKRIQSLKRGRKFIEYRESFALTRNLESIVNDIGNYLLDLSPKAAFELTQLFLETSESVLNRVDDSSGSVSDVFKSAVILWLEVAKVCDDEGVDWVKRVYDLYQKNEFGVLDPLLSNAAILLDDDQLTQLAWRYESEGRKALKIAPMGNKFNWAMMRAFVALGGVAEALEDPKLYERSITIASPGPNELQKQNIIEKYLEFNQPDAALQWLNTPFDERFEADKWALLDQAYAQQGDIGSQREVRRQTYEQNPSYTHLKAYLTVLPDDQKPAVIDQAIVQTRQQSDLVVALDLLLKLDEPAKAQTLLLARHQELNGGLYGGLLDIVKQFESESCWLAMTMCYRALLLDILARGYSKAYTHAARYFNKLSQLAVAIEHFESLSSHDEFVAKLKTDHGLKRSFWSRVDK